MPVEVVLAVLAVRLVRFVGATLCGRPPSGPATVRRFARHLIGGH
jgi:hypothetical protein